MTSSEARKLLGGYATRTLTENERIALFEAALNDQELFEELTHEQSVQEVLDDPGSRAALLAALSASETKRAWWKVWWVPGGAIAVTVCVVAAVLLTWNTRYEPKVATAAKDTEMYARSPAPPEAPKYDITPRAHKRKVTPPVRPHSLEKVETDAQSSVSIEAAMPAPEASAQVVRGLAAPLKTTQLHLTLALPTGSIHPGDEVSVTATAGSSGFVYAYTREGEGPWTLLSGSQGLEISAGKRRLLPVIRIPVGVTRVTLLGVLTPEAGSPPDPNQNVPGRVAMELLLDVVPK